MVARRYLSFIKPHLVLQLMAASTCLLSCVPITQAAELTRYFAATTPQVGQPKSDLGLNLSADALDMRGTIVTKRIGDTTLIMPQLVSSYALAPDLKFESRATFSNFNQNLAPGSDAIETSLTARSILPMLAEVQGSIRHDAAGESRRKLRVNMKDTAVPSFMSKPIVLKANATIEDVSVGKLPGTILTGVETALVQKSASSTTLNQLGFRYSTQSGADQYQRQATTLSRSWAQNKIFRLGVEYELMHEATSLQSTVRFTWKGLF